MEESRLLGKKQQAKRKGNLKLLAKITKDLGDLYYETGQLENALEEYFEQLEACETLRDKLNYAIAHRMIGEVHTRLGNYDQALDHLEKYLDGAKDINNPVEEQRALASLGRAYFCLAESLSPDSTTKIETLQKAKNAYVESIDLCLKFEKSDVKIRKEEMMEMRARLLLNLGLVLDAQNKPESGIEMMMKAATLCIKHNLNKDLHRTRIAMATFYEKHSKFQLALEHLDEASKTTDPLLKSEAQFALAELNLRMTKCWNARNILARLYQDKGLSQDLKPQIDKLLRIAVKICRTENALKKENDPLEKLKHYEILGDASCAIHNYKQGIKYYQEMLKFCEETNSDRTAAALISLSKTFKDMDDLEQALIYAQRELEVCTDPCEISRSALSVAELLIDKKSSDKEIRKMYDLALNNARKCSEKKFQVQALNEFKQYLADSHQEEEIELINDQLDKLKGSIPNVDTESEEESESQNIGHDICLDELSDFEIDKKQSSNEGGRNKKSYSRNKITVKRNDKGETALHVACIKGEIAKVEKLLTEKHPVNERDNAGWTPLHEAANLNHIEIADLLLKHGANVNDSGGKDCKGITPVHDAASCGHVSMIYLLMEYGANMSVLTHENESVLDALIAWRGRAGDLSEQDETDYQLLSRKLTALVPKTKKPKKQAQPTRTNLDRLMYDAVVNNQDSENEKISAGEDYKRTIENLKNRGRSSGSFENRSLLPKIDAPLLDSEDVLVDDWLEDDVGPSTKQKFPIDVFSTSIKRKSNHSNSDDQSNTKKRQRIHSDDEDDEDDEIQTPQIMETENIISSDSCDSNSRESTEISNESNKSKRVKPRQVSLFTSGFTRQMVSRTPSPNFPILINHQLETLNLKINLEQRRAFDYKLKFPEDEKKTIQWLMNDMVTKFYNETGCTGEFVLTTMNGDVLSVEETLNILQKVDDCSQLKCEIVKLKIPNNVERYQIICKKLSFEINESIKKSLYSSESTASFRLKGHEVKNDQDLIPLLKTLEFQENLQELCLSNATLFDFGKELYMCLSRLSRLKRLYLQGCDIDYQCFSQLDELPSQLEVLDLSYNPLGSDSNEVLKNLLIPLKHLETLNLRYCNLQKFSLPSELNTIKNLDMSWNILEDNDGVSLLNIQLVSLNLSNVTRTLKKSTLVESIIDNFEFSFSLLQTLELASCNLSDQDVSVILARAPNLDKFVLNGNSSISILSVNILLCHKPSLSYIDVSGCLIVKRSPESHVYIENPEKCLLIMNVSPTVCEAWALLWRGKCTTQKLPHNLIVFKPVLF